MNSMLNRSFKELFWPLLSISLVIHILAAYFSAGHHKLDEYDGILINVGYLLGYFDESWLSPGETAARIRAWIQPFFYAGILYPFKVLGFENPFFQTFLIRLVSSFIGWSALVALCSQIPRFFKQNLTQNLCFGWMIILWYLPFFQARGTAENLSISFFVFALFFLMLKTSSDFWKQSHFLLFRGKRDLSLPFKYSLLVGVSFGLCFLFRYQMAIMIFFFCLWLLLFTRISIASLFWITLSCCLIIALGSVIDYYGYGVWTFGPWNNWDYNVNKGVASSIGVDPWYKYFEKTLLKGIPPTSLLFMAAYFFWWIKRPGSALTWISLPFLILHSMIAHKELRFVFGLGLFLPIVIAWFLEQTQFHLKWKRTYRLIVLINLGALLVAIFRPSYSAIDLYKVIYKENIQKIYIKGDFPKPLYFYFPNKKMEFSKNLDSLSTENYWLFTNKFAQFKEIKQNNKCQKVYGNYSEWVLDLLPERRRQRSKVFFLFKCQS